MRKALAVLLTAGAVLGACTNVSTTAGGGGANAAQGGPQGYPPGRGPYPQGGQPQGNGAPPSQPGGACEDPAGTYKVTRTRSARDPGSCPPNESNFNPDIPVRVTWDGTKASQYKLEMGYANEQTFQITFADCVNNRAQCGFEAACVPTQSVYQDQVRFAISGGVLTGQIHRTNRTTGCTIKMDLRGSKP